MADDPFIFDPTSLPEVPSEHMKRARDANMQVYMVHLRRRPSDGEEVTFVAMSGFLPRLGEVVFGPLDRKQYRVHTVFHIAFPFEHRGTSAYSVFAHVFCVPAD